MLEVVLYLPSEQLTLTTMSKKKVLRCTLVSIQANTNDILITCCVPKVSCILWPHSDLSWAFCLELICCHFTWTFSLAVQLTSVSDFALFQKGKTKNNISADPSDRRWVGMWWGGFLLCGLLLIIVAIPFFSFPKVNFVLKANTICFVKLNVLILSSFIMTRETNLSHTSNCFRSLLEKRKRFALLNNTASRFHHPTILVTVYRVSRRRQRKNHNKFQGLTWALAAMEKTAVMEKTSKVIFMLKPKLLKSFTQTS